MHIRDGFAPGVSRSRRPQRRPPDWSVPIPGPSLAWAGKDEAYREMPHPQWGWG